MSNGGPIQPIGDPVAQERLDRIDAKITKIDAKLKEIETKLKKMKNLLGYVNSRLT